MLVRIANSEDPDKTAHLKASSAAVQSGSAFLL